MDRIYILRQVQEGKLTQEEGGARLGITSRQIRRLLNRIEEQGVEGIKRKSCSGNRVFSKDFKASVMEKVKAHYSDFGPTFASEKLLECNGLSVNRETLRQWMIESGLWKRRARKSARIHQSRERRPRFGELVQIDGSHHDWFEGRAPKCCLLVFIDDATSKILTLRFEESETTLGYLRCIESHLKSYGCPLAYYSDRHSIFKTTRKDCVDGRLADTQLHRALRELKIELICANSSQAKGRVERANQTLQDRLIKEMRLRQISSIEEANAYIPEFLKLYNNRFSVEPEIPQDAHQPVYHALDALRRILSIQTTRKLSKNLQFSHKRTLYQIERPGGGYRFRHTEVIVCEHTDGSVEVLCHKKPLQYKVLQHQNNQPLTADKKEINMIMDQIVTLNPHKTALSTGFTSPCPA